MTERSRTENTLRNSLWGTISKIVGMICPFFFRMFIIREIGANYIGLNGLFTSILRILNLTEFGFGSAIVFMMYQPIAEKNIPEIRKLLHAIKKIYRCVGIVSLIIGCGFYPFLSVLVKNNTGIDVNIYLLYSFYLFDTVIGFFFSGYRAALFSAHQRNDVSYKITLICEIVRYSLQAIILFITKNYYLYILVVSVSKILRNCLLYYYSRRIYPDLYCEGDISTEQKGTIKEKVIPLVGHRIGGTVIFSIDDLIISAFIGISVLTRHDNYFYIINALVTFLLILKNSTTASLGNKIFTSSKENLYKTYLKIYFIWVGMVGWCTCFLIGLYQPFMQMWVGKEYLYDDSIMIWICIYFFVWQVRGIGTTMEDAAGVWEADKLKPIIGMILNLGLSIAFVKATGSVLGVLIPTISILGFIYFPWETHVLFKNVFHRSSKEYLGMTLKWMLTIATSGTIVYCVTSTFPYDGIGWFVLRLLLCFFIPPIIVALMFNKSDELASAILDTKKLIRKMHKKRKPEGNENQ